MKKFALTCDCGERLVVHILDLLRDHFQISHLTLQILAKCQPKTGQKSKKRGKSWPKNDMHLEHVSCSVDFLLCFGEFLDALPQALVLLPVLFVVLFECLHSLFRLFVPTEN
jgi:hypothetical protein